MGKSDPPVHVLATMRLTDVKTCDKLAPVLKSDLVHRITLVRFAPVSLQSDKLTQVTYNIGLNDTGHPWPLLTRLHNTWMSFWTMQKIARREHPTLVLGVYLFPHGLIAWLTARLTGSCAVVSLIGADFNHNLRTPILGWFLRRVLRNCDAVTTFGPEVRQALIRDGVCADRVFVLPNAANMDVFHPDSTIEADVDLISVGNFIPRKRFDLLLRALKLVLETRPQTTLRLVGDGEHRAELEALAQSLGVAQAVEFYGSSNSVVDQLRSARVFVLLSNNEGLPMAVVEAMCTGLPVVVTDVGANASVVRDGENGYLLPSPADPALAANRILRLLDDAAHYQQLREAALRVRGRYGYPQATQVWEHILNGLR